LVVTALAGGVGAARFLQGLVQLVPAENLKVIINTGDDVELYGLYISPDIDIVLYTLAGLVDEEKGWGFEGDTFHCLETLKNYGYETWFNLGDKDLATHIHRTLLLRKGKNLTEATDSIRRGLKVKAEVFPMTNENFRTVVETPAGKMYFQEYMVKRRAEEAVLSVEFEGSKSAHPAPGVVEAIRGAETVIVCPSNPIVSIGTILSVSGVREALRETLAPVVAVSPIVGGATIKGPADKIMKGLGIEVSAYGVATLYKDFLDAFIIDQVDRQLKERIERLGISVMVTDTIMRGMEEKIALARTVLEQASKLKKEADN